MEEAGHSEGHPGAWSHTTCARYEERREKTSLYMEPAHLSISTAILIDAFNEWSKH